MGDVSITTGGGEFRAKRGTTRLLLERTPLVLDERESRLLSFSLSPARELGASPLHDAPPYSQKAKLTMTCTGRPPSITPSLLPTCMEQAPGKRASILQGLHRRRGCGWPRCLYPSPGHAQGLCRCHGCAWGAASAGHATDDGSWVSSGHALSAARTADAAARTADAAAASRMGHGPEATE